MSESDRVLRVCKNFVCVKKKNTRKHFSIMALDFLCMQPIETCAAIPTAVFCYMHTHIYKSTQRSCLAGIRNAFKKNSNGSMSAVYVVSSVWLHMLLFRDERSTWMEPYWMCIFIYDFRMKKTLFCLFRVHFLWKIALKA